MGLCAVEEPAEVWPQSISGLAFVDESVGRFFDVPEVDPRVEGGLWVDDAMLDVHAQGVVEGEGTVHLSRFDRPGSRHRCDAIRGLKEPLPAALRVRLDHKLMQPQECIGALGATCLDDRVGREGDGDEGDQHCKESETGWRPQ